MCNGHSARYTVETNRVAVDNKYVAAVDNKYVAAVDNKCVAAVDNKYVAAVDNKCLDETYVAVDKTVDKSRLSLFEGVLVLQRTSSHLNSHLNCLRNCLRGPYGAKRYDHKMRVTTKITVVRSRRVGFDGSVFAWLL
jgi:hypothetical protein